VDIKNDIDWSDVRMKGLKCIFSSDGFTWIVGKFGGIRSTDSVDIFICDDGVELSYYSNVILAESELIPLTSRVQPVPDGVVVTIERKSGEMQTGMAAIFHWGRHRNNQQHDIVWYRVAGEAAPKQPRKMVESDIPQVPPVNDDNGDVVEDIFDHDYYDEDIPFELGPVSAASILEAGIGHMKDRAATYDQESGERSIGSTVAAFNAITGDGLMNTEERGWLFMSLLKMVRSQNGNYKRDNYEDLAAYAGLCGESAAQERG
jgi:hypothetical protein